MKKLSIQYNNMVKVLTDEDIIMRKGDCNGKV